MTKFSRIGQMAVGAVVLLVLWQVLGALKAFGPAFPPLSDVWSTLIAANDRPLFSQAVAATASSAAWGVLLGGGVGCALAALRQTVKAMRDGWDRFAVTVHAIPHIGIAPVLIVTLGRANAPLAIASIAAFFPSYAAATRAFASATPVHQDLFSVLGSSRLRRLLKLQLPAAVPGLCDALRLAAPGAVLGAVLGEWFGAPKGVGLIILSSSQNYQINQLWAAAVLATILAMIGYAVFSLLQAIARRRFA